MIFVGFMFAMLLSACADQAKVDVNDTDKYVRLNLSYSTELDNKAVDEIYILTLNLHTYQESDQDTKFDMVAQTIDELDIDLIAFQECAQHKTATVVDTVGGVDIRSDNMAKVITDRLKNYFNKTYYYVWDWAHYGWDVWEEGIAVVSKKPISNSEGRWVSASTSRTDIHSRKAIFGRTSLDGFGDINFTCAHTSWSDEDGVTHVNNTRTMVREKSTAYTSSVLNILCGDFNCQPTDSPAVQYNALTSDGELEDTFLLANPNANNLPEDSQYDTVKGSYPGRIDYIFMMTNNNFTVRYSEIVFSPNNIGEVSDHYGVITVLKK